MYIDGLYRPRAGQALASYLDLDRVEVLRGPQGTLFGRNTLGGLVNLIAKKPDTQEFDFGGATTFGDYDLRRFEGFANMPLSDSLALRITASDTKQDPIIENIYDESAGMRDEDNTYARAQLRWEANDRFDVTFTATTWEDTSNGNADYAGVILGVPVNANGLTDGINGVLQARQGRLPGQLDVSRAPAGGRSQAGIIGQDPAASLAPSVYNIKSDFKPLRDISETSFSALVNVDMGSVGLSANLGWFDYEEFRLTDSDFSPNPSQFGQLNPNSSALQTGTGYWQQCWSGPSCGLAAGQRVNSVAYQADVNIFSTTESAFQWTLGFFYYDDSGDGDTTSEFVWGYTDFDSPQNVSWAHWLYQGNGGTKSTAIYGQASYSFNEDRTSVTAGLRYSKDDRRFVNKYVDWGPAIHQWGSGYYAAHSVDPGSRFDAWPSFVDSNSSATEDSRQNGEESNTDWKLSVQHHLNDDTMLYANAATGYIAGGLVGGGSTDLNDPNEVDAFEIGLKSTLLDGAMRLNISAYSNDYKGLTTSSFIAQGETIVAVSSVGGSMESKGLELEMNWLPSDALSISASLALNDSELKDFSRSVSNRVFRAGGDAEIGGNPPGDSGNSQIYYLDGKPARFSPDYTLSVDASYRFDLGARGTITPGINFYASDKYQTTNIPYFFTRQDSYTLTDARITWEQADGPWTVRAYITNLGDEIVQVGGDQFSEGRAVADFNRPRSYGVTARYNF
jgi:iron complex outermembrane receptor protein